MAIRLYTQGLVENVKKDGNKLIFEYVGTKDDTAITIGDGGGGTFEGIVDLEETTSRDNEVIGFKGVYSNGEKIEFLFTPTIRGIAYDTAGNRLAVTMLGSGTPIYVALPDFVTGVEYNINTTNLDIRKASGTTDSVDVSDLTDGLVSEVRVENDNLIVTNKNAGSATYPIQGGSGGGSGIPHLTTLQNGIYTCRNLGDISESLPRILEKLRNNTITIEDIGVGDYWLTPWELESSSGTTSVEMWWVVAGFNIYRTILGGDYKPRIAIIPTNQPMHRGVWAESGGAVENGGYSGSKINTVIVPLLLQKLYPIFGAENIKTHTDYFSTHVGVNSGEDTYEVAYDVKLRLLSAEQVFGYFTAGNWLNYRAVGCQLPFFYLSPDSIAKLGQAWLSNVCQNLLPCFADNGICQHYYACTQELNEYFIFEIG